jgi:hypothetical protein
VLLAFAGGQELIAGLDRARRETGENRSAFIWTAIKEELARRKIELPKGTERAPDRVEYRAYCGRASALNDERRRKGKGR